MWMHKRTKQQYVSVVFQEDGRALVTTPGPSNRTYYVPADRVIAMSDHEELRETAEASADYDRREKIQHLAHALARELSFNLGQATMNIALSALDEEPEYLLTARAAIRDEQERLREAVADHLITPTEGATDDRSDDRPWIQQHPPVPEPGVHEHGGAERPGPADAPGHIDGHDLDGEPDDERRGFWSSGEHGGERGYGGHAQQVVNRLHGDRARGLLGDLDRFPLPADPGQPLLAAGGAGRLPDGRPGDLDFD